MTLFYDTETTGFPSRKPISDPSQPHIVSIGAVLAEGHKVVDRMYTLVRPEGWTIHPKAMEVHGITDRMATDYGIPEGDALAMFLDLAAQATHRVAYNDAFDDRIIRTAIARFAPERAGQWGSLKARCAMKEAQRIAGCSMSLEKAVEHWLHVRHSNAHNALGDAQMTHRLWLRMKEQIATSPTHSLPTATKAKTKAKSPQLQRVVGFYTTR